MKTTVALLLCAGHLALWSLYFGSSIHNEQVAVNMNMADKRPGDFFAHRATSTFKPKLILHIKENWIDLLTNECHPWKAIPS
jgi:hypothetical protein